MAVPERWMIYGANGYTGRLTAELAVARGQRPVLAGRSTAAVKALARALGVEARGFALDRPDELRAGLAGVGAVVHMAGPFSATAGPMLAACLASAVHYLDITGEIDVFERVFAADGEARAAGVTLVPGVGFDVVPTDCLAARLAGELSDAVELSLAIVAAGGVSAGTAKTVVESLGTPGRARVEAAIGRVPAARRRRRIPFPSGERAAVAIGWGDVSTAWRSTGIPNVYTYLGVPAAAAVLVALADPLGPLLGAAPLQRLLKRAVAWALPGPRADVRAEHRWEVWGEVRNAAGAGVQGALTTPNGYSFTAEAALRAVGRVLRGVPAGALTPSQAFGPDFAQEIEGVVVHPLISIRA